MDAFTNTGLLALLIRATRDTAPELVGGLETPHPLARAIHPAADKTALAGKLVAAGKAGTLLSVGRNLQAAPETPTLLALRASPDPQVMAEKWMRLERYNHASHRTGITMPRPTSWLCTRSSTDPADAPTLAENLLIAGVLIGLLEITGHDGVTLELGRRHIPAGDLASFRHDGRMTATSWRIHWSPASQDRPHIPNNPGSPSETTPRPASARLVTLLATDMSRPWRIGDAARALGRSVRSLQRDLTGEGETFSTCMRRARMTHATQMLIGGETSLAEIGFCCGYADQAHFQRDFLAATNVTPRRFGRISRGMDV
ncbi:helix-turn-helix transcriptional regulator [Pyruvatibacter mobilis]|uniref:helix-turn-helix transcriptional regulator n=1 Tax=Pyruvatibacter mobilis TaxID=1712261 RepID=UPI003D0D3275